MMQAMFVQQAVVVAAMTDRRRELLLAPVMNHSDFEFGQQYPVNVDDVKHDWRALLNLEAMAREVLARQRSPHQPVPAGARPGGVDRAAFGVPIVSRRHIPAAVYAAASQQNCVHVRAVESRPRQHSTAVEGRDRDASGRR